MFVFSSNLPWCWVWLLLWAHRYIRFLFNTLSHWAYKSIPIPESPQYTSKDVTVIIPTIHDNFEELRDSLQSILSCHPFELLLVTTADKYDKLKAFVKTLEASNIQVYYTAIANKRIQVCEAIPKVKTTFMVMADDDVTWPRTMLPWVLAPFEDPTYGAKFGGVGTCQRVKRLRSGPWMPRIWNWLGAAYIERRNFEISATHGIDGGTSCMSGRTCCFRSEILQSPLFLEGFKTERWGKYQLNADDDNFVTRWLVSHNWKTYVQYNHECQLETTLENNKKFLYQCSRWARSNWRSNYTSLFTERHVWRQQPWSTYALHIATFTSLAFVMDPLIVYITYRAAIDFIPGHEWYAVAAQLGFMFITKVVKLLGLFSREPFDLIFLPVSILFGYFHGLIKLWAFFTLRMTSWGSRPDGDTNDSHRMSPRARRSDSITLPPGRHPTLGHYTDKKTSNSKAEIPSQKPSTPPSSNGFATESDLDDYSDENDDPLSSMTSSTVSIF
ncbi:glycosyltransferase family 2 protein [Bisporella sp. PMI_857]|nr:glycosyltransferase family 2 protein [Bisporella sp. PMI_857]